MIESDLRSRGRLVAIVAGHCHVPAGEGEAGYLVLRQSIAGCCEGQSCMAFLAAVAPGLARELSVMLILVAIDAGCKLDFVTRVLASGNMALSARYFRMRSHEGKAGFRVIRERKRRRAPTGNRVTAFAAAAVGPLHKLAAMRVGRVAVRACIVSDWSLEVAALVAAHAGHLEMLAKQGERGLRVVEGGGKSGLLPG